MADRILKPDSGNDLVLQNDDASAKIEINEAGTIVHTGTSSIDVSGGTFTTSSAQKQAIVQAGPGSGTLDVSSGTFTTSSAQKQAIVQAGPGSGTLDVSSGTLTTSTAQKQAIVEGSSIEGTAIKSTGESGGSKFLREDGDGTCSFQTVSTTISTGQIVQSKTVKYTGGNHSTTSTTVEVCKTYASITGVTIGNTIIFCWDGSGILSGLADHDIRYSRYFLYHNTVSRSEGFDAGDGSLGTQVQEKIMGRHGMSASPAAEASYINFSLSAPFVATATTHYVGLAFKAEQTDVSNQVLANSDNPLYCFIYEIKGDITT